MKVMVSTCSILIYILYTAVIEIQPIVHINGKDIEMISKHSINREKQTNLFGHVCQSKEKSEWFQKASRFHWQCMLISALKTSNCEEITRSKYIAKYENQKNILFLQALIWLVDLPPLLTNQFSYSFALCFWRWRNTSPLRHARIMKYGVTESLKYEGSRIIGAGVIKEATIHSSVCWSYEPWSQHLKLQSQFNLVFFFQKIHIKYTYM